MYRWDSNYPPVKLFTCHYLYKNSHSVCLQVDSTSQPVGFIEEPQEQIRTLIQVCDMLYSTSAHSTEYCNTVLQQITTTQSYNTVPQHSTVTQYCNTVLQQITTTQYCNTVLQHTTTTNNYNTVLQHSATEVSSISFNKLNNLSPSVSVCLCLGMSLSACRKDVQPEPSPRSVWSWDSTSSVWFVPLLLYLFTCASAACLGADFM